MDVLRHQRVLIVGLGETGLACARWCAMHGAQLSVLDTRAAPPNLEALHACAPEAVVLQTADALDVANFDRILAGPGLSPHAEPLKTILAEASAAGKTVDSEIELFAQALAWLAATQNYRPRLIGITGTNGKTTTTMLTHLLVERAGLTVRVAGNVRPAALDALREALADGALPAVWVLELSSFQLQLTRSLRCDVATILNITPDHLDWHASFAEYVRAKQSIFAADTVPVVVSASLADAPAADRSIRVGAGAPARASDYGIAQEGGLRWLCRAVPLPIEGRRKNDGQQPFVLQNLMPADALYIRGQHNALNALTALALVSQLDLPIAPLLHALRDYRGEPHRTEFVATVDGVDYIDDSKGTNVGATVAALLGLDRSVVLIAGGDGKGQDFAPLASPVQRYARAVILFGRDATHLAQALQNSAVPVETVDGLLPAVVRAAQLAKPGDAVLLSPACASLDMFSDYTHRAAVFRQAVEVLALQTGQPC
ncbi:MAG: UDP-N-acetylmuramoyl-L-alanine--D-glutamate ligase [Burkholderiaceae bacterium]